MFESWACWLRVSTEVCIGWPQSLEHWSVTWEALGAIGTTLAFTFAAAFGAYEIRKFRNLREEELHSHGGSLWPLIAVRHVAPTDAFRYVGTVDGDLITALRVRNTSEYPFTGISVLIPTSNLPNCYISMAGSSIDFVEARSTEEAEFFNRDWLNFESLVLYRDRFDQQWVTPLKQGDTPWKTIQQRNRVNVTNYGIHTSQLPEHLPELEPGTIKGFVVEVTIKASEPFIHRVKSRFFRQNKPNTRTNNTTVIN